MKKHAWFKSLILSAAAAGFAVSAHAQLVITEVMSSGSPQDWFEVTNYGDSSVSLTGFTMDDSSATLATSFALNGISSIGVGESVVFLESSSLTNVSTFKSNWSLGSGVKVGYYSGAGVGLASGGDAVTLFNGSGALIAKATFGSATAGSSFYYGSTTVPGTLTNYALTSINVAGASGAYTALSGTEVGSPGVSAIPEPSTYAALAGAGALGLAFWRRRNRAA